ncbi:acyltransferase domain-containing protein [Streptomyces sp. AJS327]|uniref:type I polyketide synthase n=1 Tax=Streptomyces sp. AJS327 TaxID=2545265 RepID=UPI0015E02A26|nr:type I polyketide synthase [Streptomyces sp. AJS327]MBA0053740.1 acyltransferase domain-containing protein [Streptomyces sp. AJS327]
MAQAPGFAPRAQCRAAVLEGYEMRPPITERAARRRAPEPIAMVGAGCRFAGGAHGLPGLWRLLSEGVDAVETVPPDRWDAEALFDPDPRKRGALYSRWGSFLDDVGGFDPAFFGIAPREAHEMDPQQRLLLEVAWEALEDAGQPPGALSGTATGVYTGVLGMDYTVLHARQAGLEEINPWYASGREFSFGPGRLSHLLGLQGPSLSVNTACSSSLVAVHLACQALRAGETDLALAGGVNLILSPELSVFLCKVRAMSRDGRCKPFSAAADGIVRGEGCALVVLKRLADALADGDEVLAVIRGSSVNHDGASAGLTVPNGAAQQDLLRSAVAAAGIGADTVDYVEAHGTGTPLGDPIEMSALRGVYGAGRAEEHPLAVGSLKSNLGHTDSAAGIGGLLKAALVLRHGQVPATLHLDERSPRIPWDWPVTVPTELTPLPELENRPRRAGVSAFGLSGTNAHVILEAPPAPEREAGEQTGTGPVLLPLSARSAGALTDLARAHHTRLTSGHDSPALGALAHSAGVLRTHHAEHRLAVTASDPDALAERLAVFLDGGAAPGLSSGHHEDDGEVSAPRLVFCFSGQGSQWPGMARELLGDEPEWRVFRESFDACDALVRDLAGWSPREEIDRPEETSRLSRTEFAQPTIFAVQVALAALWRSWGVEPAAVVGHSMGEIATAHVAGALSLPDAARVAVLRGQVLADSAGRGRMATVALGEEETRAALEPFADRLWVAGVNSARSTVVSGEVDALDELTARLAEEGVGCRAIPGDHPFHSPLVAGPRDRLAAQLPRLRPESPTIPVVTTTPGGADGTLFDAAHWARNVTEPVRFADAVGTLLERGHTAFVEVGPHPVLALPLTHTVEERADEAPEAGEVVVVSSLRRGFDAAESLLGALGALYARGVAVDWAGVPCRGGGRTKLPTYPWQRRRFWLRTAESPASARPLGVPERPSDRSAPASQPTPPSPPSASGAAPEAAPGAAPGEVDGPGWEEVVEGAVARILGLEPGSVRRRQGFAEMGMDSVSAIELRDQLQVYVSPLRATVPFDHPTVERLAAYLGTRRSTPERPATAPAPTAAAPERSGPAPHAGGTSAGAPGSIPTTAPAPVVDAATSGGGTGEARVTVPVSGDGSRGEAAEEPIAVVGLGCRFPGGGEGPEGYWTMLSEGTDAVTLSPEGRFTDRSRWRGAWLPEVDQFDAEFFRIAPREAKVMDPQQRMFLEVAWEALEHAGQSPDRLHGTRTGVFVGMNSHDYGDLITVSPETVDAFYGTGNSFCSTSGRLSYFLGLHGPSLAVDTACSSSLVAVHLAVRSLRSGESEVALAGGVNVIAGPTIHRASESAGALAADGRCKTFDAAADGYNRGEGCGVVVLKPLSRALADGDRVLATLLGSAVNQDGPSSGLTVPHGPAQEELIRTALADARVTPADLGYVEAHGTGTPLGDPIELEALGAALADGLPAGQRVPVGSVKTNISHLEAASGIAGLIKAVLVLWHRRIPPHLHFQRPSPEIPWDELPFDVPTANLPWPEGRSAAGVSAFGFSGTNAHVVLGLPGSAGGTPDASATSGTAETSEASEASEASAERPYLLTLSAADPGALTAQAANYRDLLDSAPERAGSGAAATADPVRALCRTAAIRRAHLPHRLTAVARSGAELAGLLGEFAEQGDDGSPGLSTGHVRDAGERRIAFVYSGHGSQWAGMGRRLLREDPVFREQLAETDGWLRPVLGWSVAEHLAEGRELPSGPRQQELIFAVQTALTHRWRALGVHPEAVAGHSLGEVAAAHAAGVLGTGEAARVLHARATTQERLVGTGAMGVVGLPAERAEEAIEGHRDRLWVALSNSSRSTVLSGDPEALDEVLARLRGQRVFCRRVDAAGAGHCPLVEPLDGELAEELAGLAPAPGGVAYYSSVAGGRQRGEVCDGAYWGRTLRDRVRFTETVRALVADGFDTFVEISPHPVLLPFVEQELGALRHEGLLLPSLRRDGDDLAVLLSSLGALHAHGHALDWGQHFPEGGPPADAPRYPWRHRSYWLPEPSPGTASRAAGGSVTAGGHPLLARRTEVAGGPSVFEGDLNDRLLKAGSPCGRLWETRLVPDATWLEMALAAAREHFGPGPVELAHVELPAPYLYDAAPEGGPGDGQPGAEPSEPAVAQLVLDATAGMDEPATFAVTTRSALDGGGTVRAGGLVSPRALSPEPVGPPPAPAGEAEAPEWAAAALSAGGVSLDGLRVLGGERAPGACTVTCALESATEPSGDSWAFPPSLLEVALRAPALALPADEGAGTGPYLPTAVDRLTLLRGAPDGPVTVRATVREEPGDGERLLGDVTVYAEDGAPVALLTGVTLEPPPGAPLAAGERARLDGLLYRQHWRLAARPGRPAATAAQDRAADPWWLLLADDTGVAEALAGRLAATGAGSVRITREQAASPGGLEKLVRDALHRPGCRGAVQLWALDLPAEADPLSDATDGGAGESTEAVYDTVFRLARALGSGRTALPVWHVTRGACAPDAPGAHRRPVAVAHTPLWSLASVAAMEHPAAWGGLLDLDPVSGGLEADADAVAGELTAGDGEDHVAVRAGRRLVQRVVRDRTRGPALPRERWVRPGGAYLVAEGAGRHGLALARRLLELGAGRVVLTHGPADAPDAEVARQVAALGAGGPGEVLLVEADGTDPASLGRALDLTREGGVPRGVFWLAVDWNLVGSDTFGASDIREAVSQRAVGAWWLDSLLRERQLDADLDHFTVFSGIAASWGSLGAARQAVPDAQLAALVQRRRERGEPGLCVRWAPWDGTGLLERESETRLVRAGLRPLAPETALTALEYALTSDSAETSVCEVDWGLMMPLYQQTAWPLFDDLEPGDEEGEAATALLRQLTALDPEERAAALVERVLAEAAVVLGADSGDELDPRRGFFDLGMNSVTALELKVRLQRLCAATLPNTLVFEYPNAEAVAAYLAADVLELDTGGDTAAEPGDPDVGTPYDPNDPPADGGSDGPDPSEQPGGAASADGTGGADGPDDDLLARFEREMAEVEAMDLGPGRWAPPRTETHDPGEGGR